MSRLGRVPIWVTALVVIGFAVAAWLVVARVNAALHPDYEGQVRDACHELVKEQLKAPTTAVFSGDEVSGAFPRYQVVGYVDSQNSFGAQIRMLWECSALHHEGDGFGVEVSFPGG